jgi:phthalate 4,5-dioxygenase oxygenase subunit
MRQYWIPALLSSELTRDGSPLRLMLLGEKLIAFRDSAGRVGVMDHSARSLVRSTSGGLRGDRRQAVYMMRY